jgi:hypothetical protein
VLPISKRRYVCVCFGYVRKLLDLAMKAPYWSHLKALRRKNYTFPEILQSALKPVSGFDYLKSGAVHRSQKTEEPGSERDPRKRRDCRQTRFSRAPVNPNPNHSGIFRAVVQLESFRICSSPTRLHARLRGGNKFDAICIIRHRPNRRSHRTRLPMQGAVLDAL